MTNITEIKRSNKAAGRHWFSKGALDFFNSRVYPRVYEGPGGIFFVSSEEFDASAGYPRRFSVNAFSPESGSIGTVGKFQAHQTLEDARGEAKRVAQEGSS